MSKTDYIKISSYVFLKKYKEKTGTDSSGVLFNKYMTLLNRELLSRGTDIHLPHCWYRWGDEVVRYNMPYINWNHEEISTTTVSFSDKRPRINANDAIVRIASDFADEFISKYSGSYEWEEAVDEVYSDAPFKFQNDFRKLRESLKISRKNNPLRNYHGYIDGLFKDAVASFPPDFGFLNPQFEEFKATFSLALSKNATPDELFEISETFWFFFCYHLRLNSRCHENVSQSTLEVWREVLPEEEDKYAMFVQNQAAAYYSKATKNPIIDDLMQKRQARLDESRTLFSRVFG